MPDLLIVGAVVDEDRQIDAYLGSGQADALRGVHGGKHVPNEIQQFVVKLSHGTSGPVQDRVSPADDRQDRAAGPQLVDGTGLRWHAGEGTACHAWIARSCV